jgi:hypothetical protein
VGKISAATLEINMEVLQKLKIELPLLLYNFWAYIV